MTKPKFITHSVIYDEDYQIALRTAENEPNEGYHYHDFYEFQFYYCEKNPDAVIGEIKLSDKTYILKSGDAIIINIFEPQEISLNPDVPYQRYCYSINSPLMLYICSEKSNFISLCNKDNPNYPHVHLTITAQKQILELYSSFQKSLLNFNHGKRFLELSLLLSMTAIIYNTYYYEDISISAAESSHIAALNKLVHYIEEHLSEDLSLEKLAEVTNFSTYYLCHLFKKYTNTTLNKYIISKRIENAKVMLADTSTPMQSISEALGFNNYNHFFRCFRSLTGISPSEYRDMIEK